MAWQKFDTDTGVFMAEARTGNIQNAVYTSLRKNIINLKLEPGTGISEKEIALRYKVSRTPVREAFIHLAKEGLVRVIPQKETVVSLIDLSRVEQEFFLRKSLEMAVLEPFMRRCGPEHFALLERQIEVQGDALAAGNYIAFIESDNAFHRIFFEAAGQNLSSEVLWNMLGHYHRLRMLSVRITAIGKGVVGAHKKILGAVKKKDLATARETLSLHLHELLGDEESYIMKEFPAYFAVPGEADPYSGDFR